MGAAALPINAMKSLFSLALRLALGIGLLAGVSAVAPSTAAESATLEAGLAVRDVTPELPIWLAGYAARKQPATNLDSRLLVQALALKNPTCERFVLVSLDNCEVNHAFTAPALEQIQSRHGLKPGEVMIVSSHTHSAPVLEQTLEGMYGMGPADK